MSDTRNHLRSVSDLYAADEIEVLLLEEIRDLEPPPTAYSRPEDIQDFEIAGSRTGGRISSQSSDLDSPGIHSTVHSWDSHSNYRGHYGRDHRHGSSSTGMHWPRSSHLVFYCDVQGHLRTTTGAIRLILLISSAACLVTLCSSGTAKVGLFMLPLVGRLRFMIFVAIFCILVTATLLFLDITHVIYIFPFNWGKVNAWVFAGIGLSYVAGSTLIVFSVLEYYGGGWVPRRTRSQLLATAALGLSCALLSFLLSWLHSRSGVIFKSPSNHDHASNQLYKPVENSSSSGATLKDKSPKRPQGWIVKNSKKRNADSDSNTENDESKYKPGVKRKDRWASTRQDYLTEDFEHISSEVRKAHLENERRRRRRRKEGQSSLGSLTTSKTGTSLSFEEAKTRKAPPRKLNLQSLERPQKPGPDSKQQNPKTSKSGEEDFWSSEVKRTEVAENGELSSEGAAAAPSTTWPAQFAGTLDDVQPSTSKTIDPYTFA